jgi:hypothetical protein
LRTLRYTHNECTDLSLTLFSLTSMSPLPISSADPPAIACRSIGKDQFLSTLEDIVQAGFYLKEEVYLKVVRQARELSAD